MISSQFGRSTLDTAFDYGGYDDPFADYADELRAIRKQACIGDQVYLLSSLPANSAWWSGDGEGSADVRLNRACSSVLPMDIATPNFEMGFVIEVAGPYSGVGVTRPNQWALVDPSNDFVLGDVSYWAQPVATDPGPYYEYNSMNGGW
jgi:hypothetical protein